ECHDIGIELAEKQQPFAHRQTTIVPAAANSRDLLVDARPALPQNLAGFGIEREDVVVAGDDIHDAVLDERRRLERVLAGKAGALEPRHPSALELLSVARVDLLQRRIT